jgi:hypothetical protein
MPSYKCECGHVSKYDARKVRTSIAITNCKWGPCQKTVVFRDGKVYTDPHPLDMRVQLVDSVFVK